MAELENAFSWSRSRDGLFQECRRKHYSHYSGSWGGWEAGAPAEGRRLYVLKQLTARGHERAGVAGATPPGNRADTQQTACQLVEIYTRLLQKL